MGILKVYIRESAHLAETLGLFVLNCSRNARLHLSYCSEADDRT